MERTNWKQLAQRVIDRCECLAKCTEEPGHVTRTFLSAPMRDVHTNVRRWMEETGMKVTVDAVGNIRGRREGNTASAPLYIGSHLDTVPRAGMFDGILGVLMGLALAETSSATGFPVEVIGFSEEEGVRFGVPFLGSLALVGNFPRDLLTTKDRDGLSIADVILAFGLNPDCISSARAETEALGYLEFHIEQGPVLESRNQSVGVVDSIVGQSRLMLTFDGRANHAGTTPMSLRHDALAGAAEWVQLVEQLALSTTDLVATVGRLEVSPGAGNVIPGRVQASLDVRHASNRIRKNAVDQLTDGARDLAARRGLTLSIEPRLDQAAVVMNSRLTQLLEQSVEACGLMVHRMNSGAGHDAMVVAPVIPSAMLFVRSPGGISHHPDESVLVEDVADALRVGSAFLRRMGGAQ